MIPYYDSALTPYLTGEKFSNALPIIIKTQKTQEKKRVEFLCDLTKNKRIIHVGFVDHIPLIREKIAKKTWLHGLLVKSCEECFGIDICQDAVKYAEQELGIGNVLCADILKDDILQNKEGVWDYIVLGEILEHTDNPVEFLSVIRQKYANTIKKIIITVPNAFNLANSRNIRKGIERINSDHRYWFSPYTIQKVMFRAGFSDCTITFANVDLTLWGYGKRKIRKILGLKSMYRETDYSTIVCVASL